MIERRTRIPIIKDVFPMTNSIFTAMNYQLPIDPGQLDLLFYNDYGLKTICPLVTNIKGDDETLSSEKIALIATMLLNKYRHKWEKYKEVIEADYDPLHNYLDEYSESGSKSEDEQKNTTFSEDYVETIDTDNTNTRTDNLSEVDGGTNSNTRTGGTDQKHYGFNSATAVGVNEFDDSITDSGTNSNTRTNTGTQTLRDVRDEERRIDDDRTEGVTIDNDQSHSKEGYHRGNIGNISTQKLVKEELDLWRWNFVEEILHDARDFLTLPLYSLYFG